MDGTRPLDGASGKRSPIHPIKPKPKPKQQHGMGWDAPAKLWCLPLEPSLRLHLPSAARAPYDTPSTSTGHRPHFKSEHDPGRHHHGLFVSLDR
ncbi:hypothetical protein FDECE_16216 [Fusarium decemcellulare]|nr:hypothetical protein FDECE_16216 [Fusarium decemcellulare]